MRRIALKDGIKSSVENRNPVDLIVKADNLESLAKELSFVGVV